MKILYIEPFYSGSHKKWIDSYKLHSNHTIDILSLPGRYWKWRMHGGAVTLAEKFIQNDKKYNLLIVSDMLNLPVFIALCKEKLNDVKIVTYFHENQISYPKSSNDKDGILNRDLHYTFINYSTALTSDFNLFNSQYHQNIFLDGLEEYLNKMPENKNKNTLKMIKDKSSVLYIGCDLEKFNQEDNIQNKTPIILWNHRWEHDKNPELFFNTLLEIKKNNLKFSLIILGEQFKKIPKIFEEAKNKLKKEIIHMGYCESFEEYKNWLNKSDILPVTSNQDFFGISIVEAVYCNVMPLLPNRLSYPEILCKKDNPELFYNNNNELHTKLAELIKNYKNLRNYSSKYRKLVNRFNWKIMKYKYDELFESIYNKDI